MGRLSKEKGVENILYALSLIQKKYPDFQMIIISHLGTSDHKRLVDLSVSLNIQDMILWKESLESEEEVKELMQSCSFGIVPSMME
jgi:glycosyltransferase involved in cell wall biosynthesis